jgi:aryl-alcohol dehydrogenase-like predicted oxidoreductase
MEYKKLGNTDLKVSSLCFGSLSISELQSNLPIEIGSEVIVTAMDLGVNFLDTAEFYNNYRYIGEAVKRSNKELIIASKSYAYTYEGMRSALKKQEGK